jgi:hypothetical protein
MLTAVRTFHASKAFNVQHRPLMNGTRCSFQNRTAGVGGATLAYIQRPRPRKKRLRSFTKKQKTANHHFTFQIIGGRSCCRRRRIAVAGREVHSRRGHPSRPIPVDRAEHLRELGAFPSCTGFIGRQVIFAKHGERLTPSFIKGSWRIAVEQQRCQGHLRNCVFDKPYR